MIQKHGRRVTSPGTISLALTYLDAQALATWNAGSIHLQAADATDVRQIVFIDGAVADAQALAAGVKPGVIAVVLDPHHDELAQIARYLANHHVAGLAAIDIVAHGSDGALRLGNAVLDAATIASYAGDFAAIGAALRPGGAVQLYGCDVAQNAAGTAFLQQLSEATGGASIAGASHLVGAAAGGGSWSLNVDIGTDDAGSPFTATAMAAYPDELSGLAANQIIVAASNGESGPYDTGTRIEQFGVSGTTEVSGSTNDIADGSQSSDSGLNYVLDGIAVDTAQNEYFVAADNPTTQTLTIQQGSLTGSGGLSTFWTVPYPDTLGSNNSPPAPVIAFLGQLAIDTQNKELYFAQAAQNGTSGATVAASTGIYEVGLGGGTPTLVTSTTANIQNPVGLALDTQDNLLFFTDAILAGGGFPATNNLDEVNLTTGSVTVLASFFGTSDTTDLLQGLAINPATDTLYLATADFGNNTDDNNAILSIPFSVTGSGSTAAATIGATSTLYSGAGAFQPSDIEIDPANGIFYTSGEQAGVVITIDSGGVTSYETGYYGGVFEGSLSGGSSLTEVLSIASALPTSVVTAENTYYPALDDQLPQLVLLTQPVLSVSGTVTFASGGTAVTLDPGATVSDPDGQLIASATISGALADDTLSFNGGNPFTFTDGDQIGGSFSAGTLTLTGNATAADYQSALDAVTFATTSSDLTPRTINWTISDGIVESTTPTSTVDVHAAPTVTAGASVTYPHGSVTPVTLDAGLTVTDPNSGATLVSATVEVSSGFLGGDTLNFSNTASIAGSYNGATGVLTLTGTDSVGDYQTALESVTYSFAGDASDGGIDTARTIAWTVNDGVSPSATATSSLSTPLCFCTGTRIATPDGEAAVESLRPGDLVRLADGGAVPVRWIGRQTVSRRFGDPLRNWPIRVRAGALGENVPSRDLLVSPGHALRVGDVLVQAAALVNGRGILRETAVSEAFVYWHIELAAHALVLAENTPAESYLETHAEFAFDNQAERPVSSSSATELPYPRCKSSRQLPRDVRGALAAGAARSAPASAAA